MPQPGANLEHVHGPATRHEQVFPIWGDRDAHPATTGPTILGDVRKRDLHMYEYAITALSRRDMDETPTGVEVNVWVFHK